MFSTTLCELRKGIFGGELDLKSQAKELAPYLDRGKDRLSYLKTRFFVHKQAELFFELWKGVVIEFSNSKHAEYPIKLDVSPYGLSCCEDAEKRFKVKKLCPLGSLINNVDLDEMWMSDDQKIFVSTLDGYFYYFARNWMEAFYKFDAGAHANQL